MLLIFVLYIFIFIIVKFKESNKTKGNNIYI
jgi:hypothetical protein